MIEKQNKVLTKMIYKNGSSQQLQQGKFNPNDEFYTGLNDIHQELNHYGKYFKSKNIICPCDCDIIAGEPVYKIVIDFEEVGEEWFISPTGFIHRVEKLTFYTLEDNHYIPTIIYEDEARDFISENIMCNFIKAIVDIGEDFGVKSITASGFNTKLKEGIKFEEVDYSLYDIVITNPPFSQYRSFMNTIMPFVRKRKGTNKPLDFILLSAFGNRINPCVGLGLMLNEFYLGFGRHKNLSFYTANKENGYKNKVVAVDWITTFNDAQCICNNIKKVTGVNYQIYKDDFRVIDTMTMKDGTHPIKIQHKGVIPDDYMGWMQGSVGILSDLNFEEFEWYITNAKKYYNTDNPEFNPFSHKATNEMIDFHGIVFRRKKTA